jgi:hypothetical protein
MPEFSATVQRNVEPDVTTVVLAGRLNLRSMAQLRTTLLKVVAECPVGVIVDVSGCRPDTTSALTAFAALVSQAARVRDRSRPPVALTLCDDTGAFSGSADPAPLGHLAVFGSRRTALDAIEAGQVGQRRIRLWLNDAVDSPARARGAVERACDEWGLSEFGHAAAAIVSELATNALVHARSRVLLEVIMRDDFLQLRVHDASPRPPVAYHGELADHGNGLRIVAAASSAWGFVPDARTGGKVVWATLRARPVGPATSGDAAAG